MTRRSWAVLRFTHLRRGKKKKKHSHELHVKLNSLRAVFGAAVFDLSSPSFPTTNPNPQGSVMPFGNTHNQVKMNYASDKEYPDLSKHNNHMAKVLTPAMYELLRSKQTPSGFTLDDVIQTGVDNPGNKKKKKKSVVCACVYIYLYQYIYICIYRYIYIYI